MYIYSFIITCICPFIYFCIVHSFIYLSIFRFAWWFSYHLSNFQYCWDWTKWWCHNTNHTHLITQYRLWCLQCPPDHTANWFIQQVFERCTRYFITFINLLTRGYTHRLGSYEVFSEHVPESYVSVLPPPPQSVYLYDEESMLMWFSKG